MTKRDHFVIEVGDRQMVFKPYGVIVFHESELVRNERNALKRRLGGDVKTAKKLGEKLVDGMAVICGDNQYSVWRCVTWSLKENVFYVTGHPYLDMVLIDIYSQILRHRNEFELLDVMAKLKLETVYDALGCRH